MQKILLEIYEKFKETYNIENWWPIYDGKEPFTEISVGAILTQNTNWNNVEKALKNLMSYELLTLEKLKDIDIEFLHELIKPAGFYTRKSKTIKEFATKSYKRKQIDREFLLSIKGIGKETADSILLYGLNRPVFVVDAYTKRLFSRLGFVKEKEKYDRIQKFFMENLPNDVSLFKEYHAGIVEHCKAFCKKKPNCEKCILKDLCFYPT
ncbi:MAG: endonuclease [Aquificae bacterium]|nr:endonuclease [Aquificota bacterium]